MENDNRINRYFFIWAMVLPITSVVLIPTIPGTTAGFMMAFLAVLISPFLTKYSYKREHFIKIIGLTLAVLTFSVLLSQLSLAFSRQLDFTNVILVDPYNNQYLFKSSMITQSLYLIAALLTFAFVIVFYNYKWDKYILIGAVILATYGLYEEVYYLATGLNGDFLSNRSFTDGSTVQGSSFQRFDLGSLTTLRIDSLTGEPSMYAFTIIPFLLYSMYMKKRFITVLLFITLCLSTSSTFVIGLILIVLLNIKRFFRIIKKSYLFISVFSFFIAITVVMLFVSDAFSLIIAFFDQLLLSKITTISGQERIYNLTSHFQFFTELPFLNMLFGIGFGYVRSTDMFTTLLINTGIFGFLIFSIVFLYPLYRLGKDNQSRILKIITAITFLLMMIAVPEFSYLPTWLFLGIAYNKILKEKKLKIIQFNPQTEKRAT